MISGQKKSRSGTSKVGLIIAVIALVVSIFGFWVHTAEPEQKPVEIDVQLNQ